MINNTLVSVTSQGQITIPAKMRRKLNLQGSKALVTMQNNKITLEKPQDLLSLIGTLKTKAKVRFPGKTMDEIIKMEEDAVADAVAERYLRKEKRSTGKLLTI